MPVSTSESQIYFFCRINWIDSGCDSKQSIGEFTDFLFNNRVDVIFGPPCTKGSNKKIKVVWDICRY